MTILVFAYFHVVFSTSLYNGSLLSCIKSLFSGTEPQNQNHKNSDPNYTENQNNITKKTKQKHY